MEEKAEDGFVNVAKKQKDDLRVAIIRGVKPMKI